MFIRHKKVCFLFIVMFLLFLHVSLITRYVEASGSTSVQKQDEITTNTDHTESIQIGIIGGTDDENDIFYMLYVNLYDIVSHLDTDVELVFGKEDLNVIDNVRYLLEKDVDGILLIIENENQVPIICGLCEEAGVYWGIYLWKLVDDDVRELCESSRYFIGNTYENEEAAGYEMLKKIYEHGSRKIALISEEIWNTTCNQREKGISDAAYELSDIEILTTVRAVRNKKEARVVTEALIQAYPELETIFLVGSTGTDVIEGIVEQVQEMDKNREINVMTIDFPKNLEKCFDSDILKISYGIPQISIDPMFLFFVLYNQLSGTPLSDCAVSYCLDGIFIENKEDAKVISKLIEDPEKIYFDRDLINSFIKAKNPFLDSVQYQKLISDYLHSFQDEAKLG